MSIGLLECQAESEEVLKQDPAAAAAAAQRRAKGKFKKHSSNTLPWRGDEEESILIAVRDEPGCALQMLDFERQGEGFKQNGKSQKKMAWHTLAA